MPITELLFFSGLTVDEAGSGYAIAAESGGVTQVLITSS